MQRSAHSANRGHAAAGHRGSAPSRPRARAALVAAVAIVATALAAGACRSARTPSPVPPEVDRPLSAMAGPCAEPLQLTLPSPAAGDTWQAVDVATGDACFRLTATEVDGTGVAADTAFRLESAVAMAPEELTALLVVEPPLALTVTESQSGPEAGTTRGARVARAAEAMPHAYELRPAAALDAGRVYSFALRNAPDGDVLARWAFQTRRALRVVQTLPADRAAGVPTNSGVELTFSHDGVTGVPEAFRIEPAVEGRFQAHGRTVVFVPESLLPRTLFTVRLTGAVGVPGSDLALEREFELRFETGDTERSGDMPSEEPAWRFSRALWEQPTGAAPALSLFSFGAEGGLDDPVPVSVYRFASVDGFLESLAEYGRIPEWAWSSRAAHRVDTDDLAPALTFDAELRPLGEYGEVVLAFPDAPQAGYYLVEAAVERGPVQAWLQVTDVATYVAVSETRTLVWVHDVATGAPITGATVAAQDRRWRTDGEGIALVDTPLGMVHAEAQPWGGTAATVSGRLVVEAPDGRTAVVPLDESFRSMRQPGFRDWFGSWSGDLYWRYLYPDRQLYRLSDEIRFWGVARARNGDAAVESVTVELRGGVFTGLDYEEPVVARATVAVGSTGTFSGSLSFTGASPGFYTLRSAVGQEELSRTGVELRDFVTPAYRIDVSPERRAVMAGDVVTLAIQASFYEGSPVPGLALQVEGDSHQTVVTDDAGGAVVAYRPRVEDAPYAYTSSSVWVRPALAEEGQMSGTASVIVVPADVALAAEGRLTDAGGVISGTVRAVDLAAVNAARSMDPTRLGGEAMAGHPVTVELIEIVQRRIETGTTYDFVNKRSVPSYRYETEELPAGTLQAVTGADGRFRLELPVDPEGNYRARVAARDDGDRASSAELYLGGRWSYGPETLLQLHDETSGPYAVGESVALSARLGDELLPFGDRYLFMTARTGLRDYRVQASPEYRFTFGAAHVPNIHVLAVRFTGATYQEAPWSHVVALDADTRALEVVVRPDRARYAPGDEVSLTVEVSGPDGRPRAATVLLSAVDAAVEDLQGGGVGGAFRSALYQTVRSGVLRTYTSHQVPLSAPGAEGGGGGEGRGDFRDVVLFQEVRAGPDGRAAASFRVPDNLTSWAVTALAVTDDLLAGTGVGEVAVGIPLFVDIIMNREYLTADKPQVRLRAFGEVLAAGTEVSYELSSDTLLAAPIRVKGAAFQAVDVPLPELTEGRHELRVAVTSGDNLDAVIRPLTVVPSRLVAVRTRSLELAPGQALPADLTSDRPVEVVVADANRGRYHDDLVRLTWAYGDRLDQVVGRWLASRLLEAHFDSGAATAAGARPEAYQTTEGGAALLPYGGSDLTLSARIAAVDAAALGRQGLVQFFTAELDDPQSEPERRADALSGLAALGEPVLPLIQAALDTDSLGAPETLALALGAARLGDEETARLVYRRLLADLGQQRGNQIRLAVGGDRDAVLEATALAAWLGALLGEPTAPMLYAHVASDRADESVLTLLEVGYLDAALPRLAAAEATVAYTRFGARQEETIEPGATLQLRVTPEELAALALEVQEGRVIVAVTGLVPLESAQVGSDPDVRVSRSYRVQRPSPTAGDGQAATGSTAATAVAASGDTSLLADGDLVRVTLDYALGRAAASGCYQLTDLLPSGLVAITAASRPDAYYEGVGPELVFPYQVVGQRVSFCVYRDGKQVPVSYLARVLGKGTYVAEPALLQSLQVPESRAASAAGEVTVR